MNRFESQKQSRLIHRMVQRGAGSRPRGRRSRYLRLLPCALCLAPVILVARAAKAEDAVAIVLQQGHSGRINAMAFAPGESLLATASQDGTARLWDVKNGQLLFTFAHQAPISRLAVSGDASVLSTYGEGVLRFWNARTGRLLNKITLAAPSNAGSVVVTANGSALTAYIFRGQVRVWDMATGALKTTYDWRMDAPARYGRPLVFTPDGNAILFQREEQEESDAGEAPAGAAPPKRFKIITFELVDAQTGQSKLALQPFEMRADQGYSPRIVFSADGAYMAQGSDDGNTRLWNLRTGKSLPLLRGDSRPIRLLAFSPDAKKLAAASDQATKEKPGDVTLWDVSTGKKAAALPGSPEMAVHALCFAPNGQALAVSAPNWRDRKASLQLWDVAAGKVRAQYAGGNDVDVLAFAPDNAFLVGSDPEGGLQTWNPQTGQASIAFAGVRQLYFPVLSPDGTRAAGVAFNGFLQIWDMQTGRLLDNAPTNPQFTPADRYLQTEPTWTPDGQALAYVVPHNGAIEIYDLKTRARRTLWSHEGKGSLVPRHLYFAPDGKTCAASFSDGKTRMLDVGGGTLAATLDYDPGRAQGASDPPAQFTPDSRSFVGLSGGGINIYNVADGQLRAMVSPGRVQDGVRLAANGALLAAMLDREVQLYDVQTGMLRSALKVTDGEFLFSVLPSPDAKLVLTRGSQRMRVWDVETGQALCTLQPPILGDEVVYPFYGLPLSMEFSSDGKYVGARPPSNQLYVWEAATGRLIAPLTPEILAGFAPFLRRPLSASGASLIVHDPRTGNGLAMLTAFPGLTFGELQTARDKPEDKTLLSRPFAWLAQTPGGYYDGSPDIARFLRVTAGGTPLAPDRAAAYHQPAQVQKALNLQTPPDNAPGL